MNADGALEEGEERLEVGVIAVEAVVELATFKLRVQQAFVFKARQFAGDIGGVGVERRGQLADVGAGLAVHVEEREQPAAKAVRVGRTLQ